jgi:hypothetical protein
MKPGQLWWCSAQTVRVLSVGQGEAALQDLATGKIIRMPLQDLRKGYKHDDSLSQIPYRRWRNRRHGFTVTVLHVKSLGPHHGEVRVDRGIARKSVSWNLWPFLGAFEPLGRKMARKPF